MASQSSPPSAIRGTGSSPTSRISREVEVVGYEGRRLVLAGEAKWSHGLEDGAALARLRRTVPYVPGYDPARTKFAVYAREGFTERFRVRAHAEGVILRTVADLFA